MLNSTENGPVEGEDSDEGPVGTQDYISPEALRQEKVSFASDLWSFGVIVWQIFSSTNRRPFEATTDEETNRKILACEWEMPDSPHLTPEVSDLISKLLVKEPNSRLGAKKIHDLIEHPLFKSLDLDTVYDEEPNLHPRIKKLNKQKENEYKYIPRIQLNPANKGSTNSLSSAAPESPRSFSSESQSSNSSVKAYAFADIVKNQIGDKKQMAQPKFSKFASQPVRLPQFSSFK